MGLCSASEVEALREAIAPSADYTNLHCLSALNSLCGLGDWAEAEICAIGNLAERNYNVEDVRRQAEALTKAAPSLMLKIHCGGDYERSDCVATITVEQGKATVGPPEIETLPIIPPSQIERRFIEALTQKSVSE